MTATPTNTNLNTIEGKLTKAVAYAGGTQAHLSLFKLLLTPALTGTLVSNGNTIDFHDYRSGQCLLFLFPPYLATCLAILFSYGEYAIYTQFSGSPEYINLDNSNTLSPIDILTLNNNAIGYPSNSSILSLVSRVGYDVSALNNIYNLSLPSTFFSIPIRTSFDNLLNTYYSSSSVFVDEYCSIANNNDKINAANYMARKFSYRPDSITAIINTVELWLYQNQIN